VGVSLIVSLDDVIKVSESGCLTGDKRRLGRVKY
jgi:hypothetical protein